MQDLITHYGGIAGTAAVVLYLVQTVVDRFNKRKAALKKDETETADSVIDLLKEQVEALETKVDGQGKTIEELTKTVDKLRTENNTLTTVLQGRDDATQKFYSDAYGAMKVIEGIAAATDANTKAITKLVTLMDGFMRAK